MPVVLSRISSPRPEDAHLIRMRNEALKHRSHRFTFSPSKAAEIEKRQKLAYERQTKKPALPKPSKPQADLPDDGFSEPEWEPSRACWLVYKRSNSNDWKAWEPMKEKWVDLGQWDESSSSSPTSSPDDVTKSDSDVVNTRSKSLGLEDGSKKVEGERPASRTRSLPEGGEKKYTFKEVAKTAWKVLAWRRRASDKE